MIAGPGSSGRREGSAVWLNSLDRLACRAIGRRAAEAVFHRRPRACARGRAMRRSIARSRNSAVGSSQNGSEKASLRSARVRPISASMWWSRPASSGPRAGCRRARASCLSQCVSKASKDEQSRAPRCRRRWAKRGYLRSFSVSIQSVVKAPKSARPLAPQPPEIPTRIPLELRRHLCYSSRID